MSDEFFCDTCEEDVSGERLDHCRDLRHELLEKPLHDIQEEKNTSKKIYQFAKTQIKKCFVSENDSSQIYALIQKSNHFETLDLSSSKTKAWLRYAYYAETGNNHSEDVYTNALLLIKAEAEHNAAQRTRINNRIAMSDEIIYYDLVSPEWRAIKITKDSVKVVPIDLTTPVFSRAQNQKQQFVPIFDGENSLEKLVILLRVPSKDRRMFTIQLISMFLVGFPIPIMSIVGEHGSIKSTISKSVKQIVDPAGAKTISLSHNTENLVLSFHNRYCVCFDNVSKINQTTSDILCKAITGDGNAKRKLYTDSDEIIYNYKRKIILNGISPNLEFPDLMDRNITYATDKVPEEERITEQEFEKKFNELLPSVLGQIFQTLSKAMTIYDSVKSEIKRLPRMADFAVWGESIARSLGHQPFSFIDNYKDRIKDNSIDIVESYPIISIIEELVGEAGHYENSVQNFFNEIRDRAIANNIEVDSKRTNFPSAPNKVREHIARLKPNLRTLGLEVDIAPYKKNGKKYKKNRQIIYIDRIDKTILQFQDIGLPHLPYLPAAFYERIRAINGKDSSKDNQLRPVACLPYIAKITPNRLNGKDGNHGKYHFDNSKVIK